AAISPHLDASANLQTEIARIRKIRQPFGTLSQKLALAPRKGYHRHWFNDAAGRIDEALASGWTQIKDPKTGQPIRRVDGTGRDGAPMNAYAMELPEVFWQEDMNAKHAAAQEKVDAIKKSPFQARPGEAKASDKGKFYDPTESNAPLQVT